MTKRQLEELIRHERFLQWLARRLLRDEARAQDVVQETWLAVLHSNKTPSEVHRGWLAGVLRNLARRKLREEGRRTRRERLAARPHAVAAEPSRLDAEELRVRLATLVLALPEHYREALLMRYYEGLEPTEIAARTGVPASTVRTRIQRGLDRVRKRLGSSTLSVAPLLQVIAAGRAPRGLRLVPGAAAALVLVAALLSMQSPGSVPRTSRGSERVEVAVRPSTRGVAGPAARAIARGREEVTQAAANPTLTGSVRLPHGVVDDFVRVEVTTPGRDEIVRATTRDEFTIDLSPLFRAGTPAELRLTATHPECETVTRTLSPETRVIHISLQQRPLLEPEQFIPALPEEEAEPADPETENAQPRGVAIAQAVFLDATVHLPDDLAPEPIALAVFADGRSLRFRVDSGRRVRVDIATLLDGEPVSQLVVRAASRNTVSEQRAIPVWSGPRLDPVVLRLERGTVVRGRVDWEEGAPAAGATVAAVVRSGSTMRAIVATLADADGAFEFAVPEGRSTTLLAMASGAQPATAAPGDDVLLVLRAGAALAGRVVGAPEGARVTLRAIDVTPAITTRYGEIAWGPRWSALATSVSDRGTFRFGGLEPGVYIVECGGEASKVAVPGQVVLAPDRVPMTVLVTDAGRPIPDARVTIEDRTRATDERGRASFYVFAGTEVSVGATAPGYQSVDQATRALAEVAVELTPLDRLGRLDLHLIAKDAPLLSSARVKFSAADLPGESFAIKDGVIHVGALAPGTYEFAVDPGGWHFPVSCVANVTAAEVTRIELHPASGGRIAADWPDLRIERAPLFDSIAQRNPDPDAIAPVPSGALPYASDALVAPGRYRLWFVPRTADGTPRSVLVDVRAGERTKIPAPQ